MFLTHVYRLLLLCILGLSFLVSGCKKDESDEEPPSIFIESPIENQTFSSIDTIFVSAVITDNVNVNSVEVELLTFDNKLITKKQFNTSGTTVDFGVAFEIDQPLLADGQYYFALRARDSENRSSAFRQILINPIPRVIDQYVVVTAQTNDVNIRTSEDLDTWNLKLNRFMDHNGTAMNYRENVIGIVGGEIGDAEFYSTTEFNQLITYTGFGTPSISYFLGLDYSVNGEHFTLLQNEPRARVLDKEAQPLVAAVLMPNFRPVKSFDFGDEYFVLEKRITSEERFLNQYSFAGLRLNSYTVLGPVQGVFQKALYEYFVWIAEPEGTALYILDIQSQVFSKAYMRPGEELKSVIEIDDGIFIFSTDLSMYRYTYSNGGTSPLNDQLTPDKLVYDNLNGLIYGIEGELVHQLSISADLIRTISFNQEVVFFGIDYNR